MSGTIPASGSHLTTTLYAFFVKMQVFLYYKLRILPKYMVSEKEFYYTEAP